MPHFPMLPGAPAWCSSWRSCSRGRRDTPPGAPRTAVVKLGKRQCPTWTELRSWWFLVFFLLGSGRSGFKKINEECLSFFSLLSQWTFFRKSFSRYGSSSGSSKAMTFLLEALRWATQLHGPRYYRRSFQWKRSSSSCYRTILTSHENDLT